MPPLKNNRHEIFCQLLVSGELHYKAAIKAGFKPRSARPQSAQILERPEVKARILELKTRLDKKIQRSIMSAVERRIRLSEFAGANLTDFIDENGEIDVDKAKKSAGALGEYSVRKGKFGVSKTIKLRDPIASIDILNKMDKLYSEQANVNNDNRHIMNIIVVDNEAKDLISQVKERTAKLIEG